MAEATHMDEITHDQTMSLLREARTYWSEHDYLPEFDLESVVILSLTGPLAMVPVLRPNGEVVPMLVVPHGVDYTTLVGEGWERVKDDLGQHDE